MISGMAQIALVLFTIAKCLLAAIVIAVAWKSFTPWPFQIRPIPATELAYLAGVVWLISR